MLLNYIIKSQKIRPNGFSQQKCLGISDLMFKRTQKTGTVHQCFPSVINMPSLFS